MKPTPITAIRAAAVKTGKKSYHGAPCINCEMTERYTINANCINCNKVRGFAYRKERTQAQKYCKTGSIIYAKEYKPKLPKSLPDMHFDDLPLSYNDTIGQHRTIYYTPVPYASSAASTAEEA